MYNILVEQRNKIQQGSSLNIIIIKVLCKCKKNAPNFNKFASFSVLSDLKEKVLHDAI